MDIEQDMKKIIVFGLGAVLVIAGSWFIFHYEPEKFENTPSVPGASLYTNQAFGFEVTVPKDFTVDESYINQALGPGHEIPGVAFRVPTTWTTGTNLSEDSHIAIEELSDVDCSPATFLDSPTLESRAVPGTNTFTVASESGAGAGNRYDETVYITQKGSRCYAVRSYVHSTAVANYPAGTVIEFNRNAFRAAFDSIASSLVVY